MVVPQNIVDFIHGPVYMCASSRDEKLRPCVVHVAGAMAGQDRETITFFVPQWASDVFVENMRANGKIAFDASDGAQLCYQIKGVSAGVKPCEDKDYIIQDIYIKKFAARVAHLGLPEEFASGLMTRPSVAITMKVEKIFDQTPGPQAGKEVAA